MLFVAGNTFLVAWSALQNHSDDASQNSQNRIRRAKTPVSSGDDSDPSESPPPVLLDEKLPGPLYGLPAIDVNLHRLGTYPRQPKNGDLYSQREKFELELLSWRAMWNADLPVHHLPAELLLHVFESLLVPTVFPLDILPPQPSLTRDPPQRPWTTLMGVCRHWCALIRNTAIFWRDIVISQDIGTYEWINLALHRVGNAPIRVDLTFDCDAGRVLLRLKNHVGHIEKLRFEGKILDPSAEAIALQLFLAAPSFPVLDSLTIALESSFPPITALCGISPHLKLLSLARTTLPWRKSIMTGLEVLSLTDCTLLTATLLPLTDFLDILEHGQGLRYLHLEHFLSASLDLSLPSAPRERLVTLPALHHFICHDVPMHVARLMTHLRTPEIANITLVGECSDVGQSSAAYVSLLPEDHSRVPNLPLAHATSVYLEICPDSNHIYCTAPLEMKLSLYMPDADWHRHTIRRALRQLPTLLGPVLTELEIWGQLDSVSLATWDLVFNSFPALERFAVLQHGPDFPTPVIRSLAAPVGHKISGSVDGAPGHSVCCPNLRYLEFDGWSWDPDALRDLLECLLFRTASGARKLGHLRLEIVGLDRDSDEVEEEYRELFYGAQAVDDILLVDFLCTLADVQ